MATPKHSSPARIIGYLLAPHITECNLFNGFNDSHFPWCLPESIGITPAGHKTRKHLYVFRCNDTSCTAKMGISSTDYHRIFETVLAHLRDKGAPKKKRVKSCPTK